MSIEETDEVQKDIRNEIKQSMHRNRRLFLLSLYFLAMNVVE